MEIYQMDLAQLIKARDNKEVSPTEILQAFTHRIDEVEDRVKSFVTLADKMSSGQNKSSNILTGIPVAVKDNMATSDLPTSCSSKILEGYTPPYDSTVVKKLRDAGAIIAGKTNMDEFAMGSSTEHSGFHNTRNPWNLDYVPGGSSGGSAAAVAAGEVPVALGSDTGGSIRQPASYTGLVGIKPTYGSVSRYGLVAFASSLDQIGPLTRTVEDAAIMLNILTGRDEMDSTSADISHPDYHEDLHQDISKFTFGLPVEYLEMDIAPSVRQSIQEAVAKIEKNGGRVEEIKLPPADHALAIYYVIAPAEASSNLARYDGVRYGKRRGDTDIEKMFKETRSSGFGSEVKRRIMLGTYALSAGYQDELYKTALKVRTLIRKSYQEVFDQVDFVIGPTSPTPAYKLGEDLDPIEVYINDIFTVPANITGMPAISLPSGFSPEGLPLGLQVIGPTFSEKGLLQAAASIENILDVSNDVQLV
ncbi:MAG: Asp-tRNA(Asn)/Glu-tRNA(Gln) amidotransferase subunit GatA [Bacillota bacterium]